jgi:UDP-N-acetylmuramoylalanine--D-glutamate ligase
MSVARSLTSRGSSVTIADDFSSDGIKTDAINVENYDAVVVSPGWKLDHPLLVKVLSSDLEVFNEVDLAWQLKLEVAPHQKWLAVTGTNGKTTTVEMLAKILQTAGIKAKACGNL